MSDIPSTNLGKMIDQSLANLSLNNNDIENVDPSNDLNSNVLQNKDKFFSSNLKKGFKRKRLDPSLNINSLTPLTPNTVDFPTGNDNSNNANNKNTTKKENISVEPKPMSATARIMLKLYGDKTQQMKESRKSESVKLNKEVNSTTISSISNKTVVPDMASSYSRDVLRKFNEKIGSKSSRISKTEKNENLLNEKDQFNQDDTDIDKGNLTKENFYEKNAKSEYISSNTTLSSKSSASTYFGDTQDLSTKGFDGDIKGSIFNDTVEVTLKWKDHLPGIDPNTKILIISKDIVSTLYSLKNEKTSSPTIFNKDTNSLAMDYDSKNNEWYMKNLFLPPGIYKLQFSINGGIYHSNYLPTATNTKGNIVNWFEVLPGYDIVEPFREETTTAHTHNKKHANKDKKDQSYKSITSLTDFTGVSRSSSSINKRNSNSSFFMFGLRKFTTLEKPTLKVNYSNEIPEIFKFDNLDDDMDSNDEGNATNFDKNFDFTLSKVVDINQDSLFSNIQRIAKMTTEEAEEYFLTKYKVPDLPIYLNSTYLNKNFNKNNTINNIIPHVNLKHLLTTSIKDNTVCVGCTIRYEGKFITQVIYAPCDYDK
ncbi:Sip1p PWA37_001757 [Arxiozyma heterogenica]|uniref:Association with the SNF1 complex (ASC) domain-containing protein n=1 Tax=Arxiozyma heterogenica TaxID=278026 RepID=A0AAN7WNQ6_9SACH|nr:hypothetical protein RI543_002415 [Kazachstania heterogenica]